MARIVDIKIKKEKPTLKKPEQQEKIRIEEERYEKSVEELETISWETLEYQFHKKSKEWFWALFIIVIGLVITAFILKNMLFAVFIILAGFTITLFSVKKPDTIKVHISGRGVQVGNRLFPYESLESFWIFYTPDGIKELSLKSKKMIMPYVKIPLGKANPVKVRRALVKYLPEKRQEESLLDMISKVLGQQSFSIGRGIGSSLFLNSAQPGIRITT